MDANKRNKLIGEKLKSWRKVLRLTQVTAGKQMGGVSFQQVQKYESGANRISVDRLGLFCEANNVSPMEFFQFDSGTEEMLEEFDKQIANHRRAAKNMELDEEERHRHAGEAIRINRIVATARGVIR